MHDLIYNIYILYLITSYDFSETVIIVLLLRTDVGSENENLKGKRQETVYLTSRYTHDHHEQYSDHWNVYVMKYTSNTRGLVGNGIAIRFYFRKEYIPLIKQKDSPLFSVSGTKLH